MSGRRGAVSVVGGFFAQVDGLCDDWAGRVENRGWLWRGGTVTAFVACRRR